MRIGTITVIHEYLVSILEVNKIQESGWLWCVNGFLCLMFCDIYVGTV